MPVVSVNMLAPIFCYCRLSVNYLSVINQKHSARRSLSLANELQLCRNSYHLDMTAISAPISSIDDFIHLSIPAQHHNLCHTPPGHVFHIIVAGSYDLSINTRRLHAHAGDCIMYHDIETVEWLHNDQAVEFYSICFQAPLLAIRSHSKRIATVPTSLMQLVPQQYTHFHSDAAPSLKIYSFFCDLLHHFYLDSNRQSAAEIHDIENSSNEGTATAINPIKKQDPDPLWTQLEIRLRNENIFRPSIDLCTQFSGVSPASLNRLCHQQHQQTPMQRFRFIRMQQAKSLLTLSPMNISQIAHYLGYSRVHEFSREFSRQLAFSPTAYRHQHAPH